MTVKSRLLRMCVRKAILLAIELVISIIQDIVVIVVIVDWSTWRPIYVRTVNILSPGDRLCLENHCEVRAILSLGTSPFFFSNFSISAFQHFNIPVFLAAVAFSRISCSGEIRKSFASSASLAPTWELPIFATPVPPPCLRTYLRRSLSPRGSGSSLTTLQTATMGSTQFGNFHVSPPRDSNGANTDRMTGLLSRLNATGVQCT